MRLNLGAIFGAGLVAKLNSSASQRTNRPSPILKLRVSLLDNTANMRAGRAKKYRKIMETYQLHFSFHEPYQVLLTASCLRAMHSFSMDTHKFLENTLHGKALPYITQCTLAKMMEGYSGKGRDGRPPHLPPPTVVPLRYCKHKDAEGKEIGVVGETKCIVDLISGQPKGNEIKRNKQHFVVGAADWDEGIKDEKEREKLEKERRRLLKKGQLEVDVRDHARMIPGVPVIYVKRSVMVLEEPSVATERHIRGAEKDKFRDGIGGAPRGLKRGREDEESEDESQPSGTKVRGLSRAKGPNPLSMRKKVKHSGDQESSNTKASSGRTRRSKRKKHKQGDGTAAGVSDAVPAATVAAAKGDES